MWDQKLQDFPVIQLHNFQLPSFVTQHYRILILKYLESLNESKENADFSFSLNKNRRFTEKLSDSFLYICALDTF